MHELTFDKDYVLNLTQDILLTDSPAGYTGPVMEKLRHYAEGLGFAFTTTQKGNGIVTVPGKSAIHKGLCAHVDTLGLMVRSVKSNGTLAVTTLGGPLLATLDGEYCTVRTRTGQAFTGTILCNSPSVHVYKDASTKERTLEHLHIRLDEEVKKKADVEKLGIGTGDFVCIDPKTVVTENGFIKSRFLDDKLSVGVLFGVLKYLSDQKITPADHYHFCFSTHEEVGHGMSAIPVSLSELLAVDMGCIGEDLNCTEYDVSICAKDSSGPYDFELTNRLIALAKEHKLHYAVDIYPFYGSDVSAAREAGHDLKGALIGPGVHASHGMERSHYRAVENAMKLTALYVLS